MKIYSDPLPESRGSAVALPTVSVLTPVTMHKLVLEGDALMI